ncbi:hypothetical protein Vi05172_g9546 [Venturia inaequalis]|nr:hypothetical protein Vi05172_g9546 [Venturia inaequalis]
MFFLSHLLQILLVATPFVVFARDCTHFTTIYVVPCPNKICPTGSKKDYKDAFDTNRDAFVTWAERDGVGSGCGGYCTNIRRARLGRDYVGETWVLQCYVPRLRRVTDQGIPGYLKGLQRIHERRACDVECGTNLFNGCIFNFGKC